LANSCSIVKSYDKSKIDMQNKLVMIHIESTVFLG